MPLLQIHFANNDFLVVRVRFFWDWVYTKGKIGFYGRSKFLLKTTITVRQDNHFVVNFKK